MKQEVQDNESLVLEVSNHEEFDYSGLSKDELLEALKKLAKEPDVLKREDEVNKITSLYLNFYKEEEKEALAVFLADGGEKTGFEYRQSDSDRAFFDSKEKLKKYFKDYRSQRAEQLKSNLQKKRILLEKLRELANGDVKGVNFQKAREIQQSWKEAEPIQSADKNELYANYHGLMTIFYNNHNRLNDLRDLDRQKNKEEKENLCKQAEALLDEPVVNKALRKFNDVFEQYKFIGRAPEEVNEQLWERIKSVSQQLRDKREIVVKEFKEKLEKNYKVKEIILQHTKTYAEKSSDNISEWRLWTDEIKGIQEMWREAGQVLEVKAKDISKEFWSYNKAFFEAKSAFFSVLDGERETNLEKKKTLIKEVESLKENAELSLNDKIDKVKSIQANWKNIGQAPRKVNDSIFAEFRTLCNSFFDERELLRKEQDEEFKVNLGKKQEVITKLAKAKSVEEFEELTQAYQGIGYVPRDNKREIESSFKEACDVFLEQSKAEMDDKIFSELKHKVALASFGDLGEKEISRTIIKLRDRVSKIDNEVDVLETNLGFFTHSKQLESVKKDVDDKKESLSKERKEIQHQIRFLKNLETK